MKRLIVFRHAKSDWSDMTRGDHARPLNPRGERSARAMGVVLARAGEEPDLAITSSAVRARTTVELAAEAGGWSTPIQVEDALYGASAQGALRVVEGCDGDLERIMIVGHQPTWGQLVSDLTGAPVEVKTATVVGIDLPLGGWDRLSTVRGHIAYVLQPRMFLDDEWEIA